jgi:hypothetical protein
LRAPSTSCLCEEAAPVVEGVMVGTLMQTAGAAAAAEPFRYPPLE